MNRNISPVAGCIKGVFVHQGVGVRNWLLLVDLSVENRYAIAGAV